jgi:hypothetical protein
MFQGRALSPEGGREVRLVGNSPGLETFGYRTLERNFRNEVGPDMLWSVYPFYFSLSNRRAMNLFFENTNKTYFKLFQEGYFETLRELKKQTGNND